MSIKTGKLTVSRSRPILAVMALMAAFTILIAACGDDETPTATQIPGQTTSPTTTATAVASPTPTATQAAMVPVESRLKVAVPPPQYIPLAMWRSNQGVLPVYEHLIDRDWTDGQPSSPMLAESWSMSPDGKTWSFTLRQGIPFHDAPDFQGPEFTAKDVVHTLQVLGSDASLNPSIWANFGVDDTNFEIVNDHELNWTVNSPQAQIAEWMARRNLAGIISKDYWDAVGDQRYQEYPVGTGPWKFASHDPGRSILYTAVQDHWRQPPYFSELEYIFSPEDATRLAMLLSNEAAIVDVARALLPEAREKGYTAVSGPLPSLTVFVFIGGQYYDGERPILAGPKAGQIEPVAPGYSPDDPMRKLDFRKAMNLAINRQEIIDAFWGDAAIPQSMFSLVPTHPDHKQEWTPYPYDPEGARQALAAAGYSNGVEIDFHTYSVAGVPEIPSVAEVIAQHWQQVGINAKLTQTEIAPLRDRWRGRNIGRLAYTVRYSIQPFQLNTCYPMSNVAGGCGSPQWEYDELDQMWLKLNQAVTPEDITRYTHEVGDFLYNNYVIVPLAFLLPQAVYNPQVVQEYHGKMIDAGPVELLEEVKPVYQ
jgi:dipeptide transport system substrate-binding protein